MKTQNNLILLPLLAIGCIEVESQLIVQPEIPVQPAIYSFFPDTFDPGTTITLYGENFGTSPLENFITFDQAGSEAHSGRIARIKQIYNAEMLQISVPDDLTVGTYTLTLTVKGSTNNCPTLINISAH
nr:hypothetical protein [Cytophagales bacterium]